MSEPQTYDFHLIFKGLFRCVPGPDDKTLSILLVDARSPKRSVVTKEPLRDHRAVIEFLYKDWRNPTQVDLRNFVEVKKPRKEKVGIYMLDREDVRFAIGSGELSPELTFKRDESPTSFLRLPRLEEIAPAFAAVREGALNDEAENCVARFLNIDRGLVSSERPSKLKGSVLRWAYSVPRSRESIRKLIKSPAGNTAKEALREEIEHGGKEVSLDLKITMQVPGDTAVFIDPRPFPGVIRVDPPAFILQPPDGGDLTVWVKNRELEVILTESDEDGREDGCLEAEFVDHDFELIYDLSTKGPTAQRRIPYRSDMLAEDGEVTAGGCACGGCA